MEFLPQVTRRLWLAGVLVLGLNATGCVTTDSLTPPILKLATVQPCQVLATWKNEVMFVADPTHGGAPTPGIAGRMYLFGERIDFPTAGDGTVVVDLFDESQPKAADAPPLEEWQIDKVTLKRLLRRDTVGNGYTLFLPWATYKPEITRVRLKLYFQPVNGMPLYAPSSAMTLNRDPGPGVQQASAQVRR